MSAQVSLQTAVRAWERRRRLGVFIENLPRAMLPGTAVGAALALFARLRPGPADSVSVAVALAGAAAGVLVLAAWIWLRPRTLVDSARWFDLRFNLKERISTALELIDGRIHADAGLTAHQLDDAQSIASGVPVNTLLPFTSDRRAWVAVVMTLAVLAVLIMMIPPAAAADSDAARERAAIAAAADQVAEILEDIAADPNLSDDQRGPLLEALQAQLETMRDPNITLDEALATLSEVEGALSEQAEAVQAEIEQGQSAEEDAANALGQGMEASPPGQTLQQRLESLEQSLNQMNENQLTQAAEALENAAEALEQTNPEAAQALRDAAQALREGDREAAAEALRRAAEQAQRGADERSQQSQQSQSLEERAQQAQAAQQTTAEAATETTAPGRPEEGPRGLGDAQEGAEGDGMFGQQASEGETEGQGGSSQLAPPEDAQQGEDNETGDAGSGGQGMGDGTANLADNASAQADRPSANQDENNPDGAGFERYQPVFAPRFSVEAEGGEDVRLQADPGDTPLDQGEFDDNPLGESVVPYNTVFSDYADAASRALESGYIPLGMRDVIRSYFSSLDPAAQP